ncbi:hypothetical protein GLOIN_2v1650551 [Rhizophagus irregularis DAOM 181602=DAOM 197198]|uniref:Uncharacterized protein n=1 Tax=Rhizophagus irregularis (strain DAOM 181602 / DAOM 197198 / MUCL 43194) TaxID=747089 RepID=A0A2P4PP31_RHIID|nr:hypothetical protein GLOIN_2v1650551 [Rhizophagus irregularis DAOM 181602=DAOM 197198]POG67127.1 hypothetical protein GLOIN_2v1650551 [Rhizophagus irregularis DAOM 181602=DAOM 197198]|eukprot:XP_025173993.1 hypothetical protein GLOIN_2v1650551 [Rhizophagus irregularis DAOM 181602=DAOM 197198]
MVYKKYNNQKSTPRERIRLTKKKNKCSSQKNHNKQFFVRKSKKEKEEGKETQKLSQRAVRVASEFFLQNRELREEIIQLRQEVQELQEEVQVREDFSIIKSSQESQVRQELQQQVQQLQQQLSSLQEQLQEASSRDELVEQQQAPLTSSEQYQLVAENEIMLNDIQECDDFIQRLKNERVNEHLAFRRQISALKEDCNRLRRERNAAHHRAEGMIVLLRNRDNSRNPPSSV